MPQMTQYARSQSLAKRGWRSRQYWLDWEFSVRYNHVSYRWSLISCVTAHFCENLFLISMWLFMMFILALKTTHAQYSGHRGILPIVDTRSTHFQHERTLKTHRNPTWRERLDAAKSISKARITVFQCHWHPYTTIHPNINSPQLDAHPC